MKLKYSILTASIAVLAIMFTTSNGSKIASEESTPIPSGLRGQPINYTIPAPTCPSGEAAARASISTILNEDGQEIKVAVHCAKCSMGVMSQRDDGTTKCTYCESE